jgi:hypothetical protein
MQFRISKLMILINNIMTEKGNQAWHAVLYHWDLKQSMVISEAIQECLVKDPLKAFYDLNWKLISGGGYVGLATNEKDREQQERLAELISTYSVKEWKKFEKCNVDMFEKVVRPKGVARPKLLGNRIMLDIVSRNIYQVGGYVTAPHGTRIKCFPKAAKKYIQEVNKSRYEQKGRFIPPFNNAEDWFLLPMSTGSYN